MEGRALADRACTHLEKTHAEKNAFAIGFYLPTTSNLWSEKKLNDPMKAIMKIRPAKNHDARKIYEFLCEKEEFLLDFRVFEIHYRDCIGNNDNIYLVAVDERNEAIGFISCHGALVLHQGGMVYTIQELFILGRFRKAGIGRM